MAGQLVCGAPQHVLVRGQHPGAAHAVLHIFQVLLKFFIFPVFIQFSHKFVSVSIFEFFFLSFFESSLRLHFFIFQFSWRSPFRLSGSPNFQEPVVLHFQAFVSTFSCSDGCVVFWCVGSKASSLDPSHYFVFHPVHFFSAVWTSTRMSGGCHHLNCCQHPPVSISCSMASSRSSFSGAGLQALSFPEVWCFDCYILPIFDVSFTIHFSDFFLHFLLSIFRIFVWPCWPSVFDPPDPIFMELFFIDSQSLPTPWISFHILLVFNCSNLLHILNSVFPHENHAY